MHHQSASTESCTSRITQQKRNCAMWTTLYTAALTLSTVTLGHKNGLWNGDIVVRSFENNISVIQPTANLIRRQNIWCHWVLVDCVNGTALMSAFAIHHCPIQLLNTHTHTSVCVAAAQVNCELVPIKCINKLTNSLSNRSTKTTILKNII